MLQLPQNRAFCKRSVDSKAKTSDNRVEMHGILETRMGLQNLDERRILMHCSDSVYRGKGPTWLFDLDYLTDSINYHPVSSKNQANLHAGQQEANQNAGLEEIIDSGDFDKEDESAQDCFVLPIWPSYSSTITPALTTDDKREGKREEEQVFIDDLERLKRQEKEANEEAEALRKKFEHLVIKEGAAKPSSTNIFSTVSTPAKASSTNLVNIVSLPVSTASPYEGLSLADPTNPEEDDSEIPLLEDIYIILGDPTSAVQTRRKVNTSSRAHAFVSYVQKQKRTNHKDFHHCLFACFLSQHEPKKISEALEDESWVDAMQEELLQFEIKSLGLVDLPYGKRLSYKDIDMRKGLKMIEMDVKSAFLYGKIDEEVYVSQPPGFQDPKYPQKVYKVVKALYGLHQAPRAWYATLSTFLLKNGYRRGTIDKTLFLKKDKHDIILVQVYVDDIIFGSTKKSWCDEFEALMKSRFQMSSMGELTFFLGLQVKQKPDGIFISQDKYVAEILKKFDFASVKTASTPIETQKPLVKDEEASDVDVHLYRSMIGSLMYVTASRPDIMFAVCACSRFQVTPKTSHLSAVKANPNWAFGILETLHLTWNLTQIVIMLEQILTGNPQQEVVNFLAGDSLLGNAKSKPLWPLLLQKPNMLLLQAAVGKFYGFKIKYQAKEIKLLKAKITKLKKKANPVIKHFKAYQKRISKEQRQQRKSLSKKKKVQIESVSKQGRKNAKGDGKAKENAQSEGRTRKMMDEVKETDEVGLSTEDGVSTDKEKLSTDFEEVSTDRPKLSTDDLKVSTDEQMESTNDQGDASEEIFEVSKTASKEKEKGIELKDVEDTDRPRPTSTRSTLTLKPLPKIDPKDKGKKKIEEEDKQECEDDIPQAVKKFKQLESDEELARKVQEEWEAEEERNKIAEEQATNEALIKDFDDIKARIEADRILAEKLQEQEREQFTIEERAKFLHDTIAAQRKFLAQQRSQAIRNKPPTKNQLRNQMITYLKHVGNFKHANLKGRKFEDIQALYEKIKRLNEHFNFHCLLKRKGLSKR
ncbi:putative ribonuclease H-like domain-containing protein [Tanacetum coccineum]